MVITLIKVADKMKGWGDREVKMESICLAERRIFCLAALSDNSLLIIVCGNEK